jgi:peroxiredoxin
VRRLLAAVALVLAATTLAGCGADPLADQYRAGSSKDYIAGDGTVETYAPTERRTPDRFSGQTDQGGALASADLAGTVTVLNFWYASCPPCRAEAPALQALSKEFSADGVRFVGVNTRDEAGTAAAFASTFKLSYPSILDYKSAAVQLAFSASIPPNAVPTTLVLDRKGRIAARILGEVTEPSILRAIISDTVAETD